jgi:hypothetical protein
MTVVKTTKKAPYVVVRTYSAGVHVGELVRHNGKEVKLRNASRVWRWRGANTLHELSQHGASLTDWTRISEQVSSITLTEAIEVIECSSLARENLSQPRWK